MKISKWWAGLVAVAFLAALGLAIAATAPDSITLDKVKDKQTPVVFPHKKHAEDLKLKCKTCHHEDADANKAVKSCFSCHKAASADDAPSAKTAFHDKCQGCHKDKLAANPKAPTKCLECHKRVSPP